VTGTPVEAPVRGLTTAEIAHAFVVPEATMAQRISRAKQRILAAGARFVPAAGADREARRAVSLHVLYLIFNEGYAATNGSSVTRDDLTDESIRLARDVRRSLPNVGEVAGLLALMHGRRAGGGPGRAGDGWAEPSRATPRRVPEREME
jgi:predicted RNA polymerase sigma factor